MAVKIVVLDGHTLNPGDIGWKPIEALGDLTVHDRTPEAKVVDRAADAAIVLTNKTLVRKPSIDALSGLQYIGVLATGTNVVDLEAARAKDIPVTNVPGYGAASVAQHVFALLLEMTCHVGAHDHAVHDGQWTRCPDFSFTLSPLVELEGKTLGIVGLGAIGRRVARIGAALGMRIAAAHQSSMHDLDLPGLDVNWLPVDELFAQADVLTLHCPLTPATEGLVSAARLAGMKRSALLINTGRGPLVDEAALADALRERLIAGAAVDVLSVEPPAADNPLLSAPHCIITPHNAWATVEARQRLMRIAADNIRAFLDGRPVNVVN